MLVFSSRLRHTSITPPILAAMEGLPMSEKEKAEFIKRVLLSLVVDVSDLVETVERTKVQVFAMAKGHGIKIPAA